MKPSDNFKNTMKAIYVDLFAGGGGTTTGVHSALFEDQRCAIVAACINHDKNALKSHKSNHKQTLHFTEDITLLYNTERMKRLISHVEKMKAMYPDAILVLWASLECTNFSKAKGGQSRDADSRTLAHHLYPYIQALQPDRIQIENVEEFMSWGALDDQGKPICKLQGTDYTEWVNHVSGFNYKYDYRILNAADFGAVTSRKRFFGQFVRPYDEIYWPEPTHAQNPTIQLFGSMLKKWRAVKEVLDFTDEGESIFNRKKNLVDPTLNRVYAGLIKFVAGGKKEFLIKWNSMSKEGRYVAPDLNNPCPTVTTQNRLGLGSVDFLSSYYGSGDNISSIIRPCPTVTTKDRIALVKAQFIDQQYGTGIPADINQPVGTITTIPKFSVATVESLKPGKYHYLVNPQFNSEGWSIDRPCFTLIAKMDKRPPSLVEVTTESTIYPSFIKEVNGSFIYEIYETDSEILKKIKEFMAMYGILDIKMRMLRIPELKKIMGFPEDYILIGSQAEQKKFIGNAVEVHMAKAMVEAMIYGYFKNRIAA